MSTVNTSAALWEAVTEAATGTRTNRFDGDLRLASTDLDGTVRDARVLVIGGAGSIGSEVFARLVSLAPASVAVVDHDENGLAELIRRLRSRPDAPDVPVTALPLDFGGSIMERKLRETEPFDVVLNFAAVKHVRSEKDVYSVLHMLDVNVLAQRRLLEVLCATGAPIAYFSVSTDKAAEPVSFMGASKRLMEEVALSMAPTSTRASSARFANVAFSAGSLLDSVLKRVRHGELIACPANTRRFFISGGEAASICLAGLARAPQGHIVFPALDPERDMPRVVDVVARVLELFGYTARFFDDEAEARAALARGVGEGWWPVLLTAGDTEGEKPYERFVDATEEVVDIGLEQIKAIRAQQGDRAGLDRLLDRLDSACREPSAAVSRDQVEQWMADWLPQFQHARGTGSLDEGV